MADEKQPKVTIWLARNGFRPGQTVAEMRDPEPLYIVQRAQNTTSPRVGDRLDEVRINALVWKGVTVNIG